MREIIWGLVASSIAVAGTAAPPDIAFATAGTRGDAIYLVDSDGTGLAKIYQGKTTSRSGAPIDSLAIVSRPDGGEVAFTENNRVIKVQKFDDLRRPVGAAYVVTVEGEPNCLRHDLDYRVDGTLLIATCSKIWAVPRGAVTADASPAVTAFNINGLAAVDGAILFTDGNVLIRQDAGGASTVAQLDAPYFYIDSAGTTAHLSDISTFQTVQLTSGQVTPGCTTGGTVEVSPDGSEILYRYRGWAYVHSASCSGMPFRLAKGVRSIAWRTY